MDFAVLMSLYASDKPKFFEQALESVTTNQTVKPIQVVIVKDGPVCSQFDEIIDRIRKKNSLIDFCVVGTSANNGLASALNYGLNFVKTEWVARMDADDISVNNRFELQTRFLESNPAISVLGGFTEEFNDNPGDLNRMRQVPVSHKDISATLKKKNPINHPTVMAKKQDIITVGGYSTNCGKLEDYKLWIDMYLKDFKFHNLNSVLVNMRVGNGFIERRSNKREIIDWDNIQRYMRNNKMISLIRKNINKISIRVFIYSPIWLKRIFYNKLLRKHN